MGVKKGKEVKKIIKKRGKVEGILIKRVIIRREKWRIMEVYVNEDIKKKLRKSRK